MQYVNSDDQDNCFRVKIRISVLNLCRVAWSQEKTGGVVISRAGGTIYLFRGRNYQYKTRPKFPLMLWKPPTPIYPKLIVPVPEGLTEDEAKLLRAKARRAEPLCKLCESFLAFIRVYAISCMEIAEQ